MARENSVGEWCCSSLREVHFRERSFKVDRRLEGAVKLLRALEEWSMKATLKRFVRDESGATAIEYGLIAAGISVAIIAVVKNLGANLNTTFTTVSNALK